MSQAAKARRGSSTPSSKGRRSACAGGDDRRAAAKSRATQRPLAVVIVFGTLSACALTLVLLPVTYRLYARRFEKA